MSELVHQLGIDWRLLLSQAANFLLLLIILRMFAYGPVLRFLKDRQAKIADGLAHAKEAEERLHEANLMAKDRLKAADEEALRTLRLTETKAKDLEAKLLAEAHVKEKALLANAELMAQGQVEQARREVHREAAALVKAALVKAVRLDPKAVDEALIKKAVDETRA